MKVLRSISEFVHEVWTVLGSGDIPDPDKTKESPSAFFFRRALPTCNVCGLAITGHQFGHIAVTAITDNEALSSKALLAAVDSLDWDAIIAKQDFEGRFAALQVFALECPDERQSLVVMWDGPDLCDTNQFVKQQPIPNGEASSRVAKWETL